MQTNLYLMHMMSAAAPNRTAFFACVHHSEF